MRVCVLSCFSHVQFSATLWTEAHQAPLSIDSPDKNTGVGCHALLQGSFPTQGLNPASPIALAGGFFSTSATSSYGQNLNFEESSHIIMYYTSFDSFHPLQYSCLYVSRFCFCEYVIFLYQEMLIWLQLPTIPTLLLDLLFSSLLTPVHSCYLLSYSILTAIPVGIDKNTNTE